MLRAALPLLAVLHTSAAFYVPIDQNSAPYLRAYDGTLIDWSTGLYAALTDTSRAIRVTSRGIHFHEHEVKPQTKGTPCARSSTSLCVTKNGSRIFPENTPPRYHTSRCGSASAGRVLVQEPYIDDISACDIVKGQLYVIYTGGILYLDENLQLQDWTFVLLYLVVLYLVISLGQNIARVMGDAEATVTPRITETVCLVVVVVIPVLHSPERVFVSSGDRQLFNYTLGYIIVYLVRHLIQLTTQEHVFTFNVIVATLILVTARLYFSFQNPYVTIFLFFLLTRFFHKIRAENKKHLEKFILTLDSVFIAFYYKWCFAPTMLDTQAAPIYLASMCMACYVIGEYTASAR